MKRPVAARHPADAAVNAPQASPIQPRRPISGDVSSSETGFFLADGRAAAVVVRPASLASFVAAAGVEADVAAAAGTGVSALSRAGGVFGSSAISVSHLHLTGTPAPVRVHPSPYPTAAQRHCD